MPDFVFPLAYFFGLIASGIMRAQQRKQNGDNQIAITRATNLDRMLLGLSAVGMVILPLIYVTTSWLDFADYQLPDIVSLPGMAVYAIGLWLLWRSHADLGHNWMPTMEVRNGHTLITQGVFRSIRHPMYAAHWLWAIAQPLLLQNWIAGFAMLVAFAPLYLYRVSREEEMLIDLFGNEYQVYMDRTGRIIPRVRIHLHRQAKHMEEE